MYYTYILELSNGEYYAGFSTNLKKRILEHQLGQERTTRKHLPCKLVSYTAFTNKNVALKFEQYLKTGSGKAFRNKHLI